MSDACQLTAMDVTTEIVPWGCLDEKLGKFRAHMIIRWQKLTHGDTEIRLEARRGQMSCRAWNKRQLPDLDTSVLG